LQAVRERFDTLGGVQRAISNAEALTNFISPKSAGETTNLTQSVKVRALRFCGDPAN